MGPGLLESAYEACLAYELRKRGLVVETQVKMPVRYEEVELDVGYRLDLLVEDSIVVEIKAVEVTTDIHEAPLLSYLKMSGRRIGLLLNFNVPKFMMGITRLVNRL